MIGLKIFWAELLYPGWCHTQILYKFWNLCVWAFKWYIICGTFSTGRFFKWAKQKTVNLGVWHWSSETVIDNRNDQNKAIFEQDTDHWTDMLCTCIIMQCYCVFFKSLCTLHTHTVRPLFAIFWHEAPRRNRKNNILSTMHNGICWH